MKNEKGYIKVYNDKGKLKFEGDHMNGKRNGKGIEYDCFGKVIIEVEYLNGERNRKGKEYYNNGKLKFRDQYVNGKKWEGKGYDDSNNIVYELKEGKGLVKEYDYGNLRFEGVYLNGLRNGKGKEFDSFIGNLIFEGEYLNGKKKNEIIYK